MLTTATTNSQRHPLLNCRATTYRSTAARRMTDLPHDTGARKDRWLRRERNTTQFLEAWYCWSEVGRRSRPGSAASSLTNARAAARGACDHWREPPATPWGGTNIYCPRSVRLRAHRVYLLSSGPVIGPCSRDRRARARAATTGLLPEDWAS
eukprot:8354149-Pyramimonas_sp.AAC.1